MPHPSDIYSSQSIHFQKETVFFSYMYASAFVNNRRETTERKMTKKNNQRDPQTTKENICSQYSKYFLNILFSLANLC